jgi:formylglycine-generating enzyme required for sulfatase activity
VIYLGVLDGRIDPLLKLSGEALNAALRGGQAVPWAMGSLRWSAVMGLAAVFVGGVVLPYVRPAWLPGGSAAAPAVAASVPSMAEKTRFRDCRDGTCPWMVVIPAGSFMMGSPETEKDRDSDEGPQHKVTIPNALAVMETEVTVGMFKAFVDETKYSTGSSSCDWKTVFPNQTAAHPAVCISWNDAQAFVQWMSKRTGQVYRLLTEAEWEYATRAGSSTAYSFGDSSSVLGDYAWFSENSSSKTHPVRTRKPNAFGLYDLHGNAWEWTQDCWHDTYENSPTNGESWETSCKESRRVLRGGSWGNIPRNLRSADRSRGSSGIRSNCPGFRVARTISL